METTILAAIIGIWLLLVVPMALIMLLPTPHDQATNGIDRLASVRWRKQERPPEPGDRQPAG